MTSIILHAGRAALLVGSIVLMPAASFAQFYDSTQQVSDTVAVIGDTTPADPVNVFNDTSVATVDTMTVHIDTSNGGPDSEITVGGGSNDSGSTVDTTTNDTAIAGTDSTGVLNADSVWAYWDNVWNANQDTSFVRNSAMIDSNWITEAGTTVETVILTEWTSVTPIITIVDSASGESWQFVANSGDSAAWINRPCLIKPAAQGCVVLLALDGSGAVLQASPLGATAAFNTASLAKEGFTYAFSGSHFNLTLPRSGSYQLSLYALSGRQMAQYAINAASGMQQINLAEASIAAGSYVMHIAGMGLNATVPLQFAK